MGFMFSLLTLAGLMLYGLLRGFSFLIVFYMVVAGLLTILSIPSLASLAKRRIGVSAMRIFYTALYLVAALICYFTAVGQPAPAGLKLTAEINRTSSLLKADKGKEAVDALVKIAEQGKNDPYYSRSLAAAYLQTGDYVKAEESLRAAFTQNPTDASNYFNYGLMLYKKLDYANAKANFIIAMQMAPELWQPYYYAGLCARQAGSLREAVYYLERAHARLPGQAEITYNLARSYYDINDWPNAAIALKSALDAGLPAAEKAECTQLLADVNANLMR